MISERMDVDWEAYLMSFCRTVFERFLGYAFDGGSVLLQESLERSMSYVDRGIV